MYYSISGPGVVLFRLIVLVGRHNSRLDWLTAPSLMTNHDTRTGNRSIEALAGSRRPGGLECIADEQHQNESTDQR
jgi:hypothetical protein